MLSELWKTEETASKRKLGVRSTNNEAFCRYLHDKQLISPNCLLPSEYHLLFNNFAFRSGYRENSLIDPTLRRHCKIAHYRCDSSLRTRESGNTTNRWKRIAVCLSSKRRERLFAFNDWTFRGWSTSLAIFKRTWDCISKTCFSKLSRQNSPITWIRVRLINRST